MEFRRGFPGDPAAAARPRRRAAPAGRGYRFGHGPPLFEALVESLARCLEVHGAWVAELVPERRRRRGLAFWSGGRLIPDFEYELAGTPCELVIDQRGLVNFSEGVADLFPTDSDPKALSAVRDMGAPLVDLLPASP